MTDKDIHPDRPPYAPTIEYDKDITQLTTFGVPAKCKYYAEYKSIRELIWLSRREEYLSSDVMHMGGGSNLLFVNDYDGFILRSAMRNITQYRKDDSVTYVIADAGVKWTDLVQWTLDNDLEGLENMAGIPGEVGASAVQNVGAYGVEAKDVIFSVECFDTITRETVKFTKADCRFGYRDSRFKNEWKNRYFVVRVSFALIKGGSPRWLEYDALRKFADALGHAPSPREIAEEVVRLRDSKLPDPAEIGSAGSFFKNPIIRRRFLQEMEELSVETIPYHLAPENELPADADPDTEYVKVSAAWLIDRAGLKGARVAGAEVYSRQPLVIVNTGNATGHDVVALAKRINREVRRKFYISLHPEVNYIDSTMEIKVLGSGTSKGVPEVGCECEVCTSRDPKDYRTRASVLVKHMGLEIMIDASPDFREQALKADIHDLDAVLLTHSHYDHVGGIDDLRPFCLNGAVPLYMRQDVSDDLHKRLDYCFTEKRYPGVPRFDVQVIDNRPFYLKGVKITPIEVYHGKKPIYGYRIGNFAYITDAKHIDFEEKEKLCGLDVLIVNALRQRDHFAHFTLDEAIALIEELKPGRAYLTHFCHEIGRHEDLEAKLPPYIRPCYDGLTIHLDK